MIQSMTAFTRQQASGDWGVAVFEVRSVNHRYLEPSLRLPESLRALEPKLREITREYLNRGKVEITLRFQAGAGLETDVSVNLPLAKSLLKAGEALQSLTQDSSAIRTMDILRWPGMVIVQEDNLEQVHADILQLYRDALEAMVANRRREGEALKNLILDRLSAMDTQVAQISDRIEDIIATEQDKVRQRVADLDMELDPARVEQEVVYLTQKADVAEELDRLRTHLKEVKRVVNKGGVIGRRLDFLMQELNREANTLGSKSIHVDSTNASVEMKVIIEQMREQIQNIE